MPLVKFSQQITHRGDPYSRPNPGDYQLMLFLSTDPDTKGWDITFKNNLLADEKGRVVYIGGN